MLERRHTNTTMKIGFVLCLYTHVFPSLPEMEGIYATGGRPSGGCMSSGVNVPRIYSGLCRLLLQLSLILIIKYIALMIFQIFLPKNKQTNKQTKQNNKNNNNKKPQCPSTHSHTCIHIDIRIIYARRNVPPMFAQSPVETGKSWPGVWTHASRVMGEISQTRKQRIADRWNDKTMGKAMKVIPVVVVPFHSSRCC